MWMPDRSKSLTKPDAALIDRDYEDLLFYDYPILFTGVNSLSDRIIGSFVEHKNGIESHLHAVVDEKTFSSFINRKISYPQVLQRAYHLFLLHWTGEEHPTVYWLNYDEIPEVYRPDELAWCPEIAALPSVEYEARFDGGLADSHRAYPETISKFQNKFAALLRTPFSLKALSNLVSRVLLQADESSEAYAPGSLKIKYHVELTEKAPTLFHDPDVYSRFLNKYIAYCIHNLPEEAAKLFEENQEGLENFNQLINDYERLVGQSNDSPEQRRKELAGNILQVARKLGDITSIVKDEFDQVVLSSVDKSNTFPLGVLDESLGKEVEEAILEVEAKIGKQTVKEDELGSYEIHIYDLNTDTRKGRGLMQHPTDPKKLMKPTLKISGTEPLTQTKYTESLHFDVFIEVRGRATRTDETIKHIDIEFEP
jgi:hypothetical protein